MKKQLAARLCKPRVEEQPAARMCRSKVEEQLASRLCRSRVEEQLASRLCRSRVEEQLAAKQCRPKVEKQLEARQCRPSVGEQLAVRQCRPWLENLLGARWCRPKQAQGQGPSSSGAVMYQEVAFLANSTEHQFTPFHFKRVDNPQEVQSKKGLFYKRAQLLLQPQPCQQDGDEIGLADGAAIINVGGIKYRIPWSTLEEFPLTRLGKLRGCSSEAEIMDLCDDYDGSRNEYFFDRSPLAFRTIVSFLAAGKLRLLREMCALSFQEELLYWGVEENNLDWCCLRKLRLRQEEYKEQQRLEEEEAELTSPQSCDESQQPPAAGEQEESGTEGCMRRLRDMVENPHSGLPGKIFACLSVLFVAITAVTLKPRRLEGEGVLRVAERELRKAAGETCSFQFGAKPDSQDSTKSQNSEDSQETDSYHGITEAAASTMQRRKSMAVHRAAEIRGHELIASICNRARRTFSRASSLELVPLCGDGSYLGRVNRGFSSSPALAPPPGDCGSFSVCRMIGKSFTFSRTPINLWN
ncbi:hypothetical protein FQN60_014575 [Etheostoma spectabile]|uniref:Potassium channel tetramerisation-type BTB domain-containing protein n=1 Tax=Etheostoma spectabile TaxID=54343 RepID=A0A5J5DDP1_9PERO|nr:hypothetical protein FQN60_014575 [Etheostoma spectabile]